MSMEPANLRHHQDVFRGFMRLVTIGIAGTAVLLVAMALFLL